MKKIIILISMAVFFVSCTKEVPTTQVVSQIPQATIISVYKVYAGANANNKITYTLSNLQDVQKVNFIISGSTVIITIPAVTGKAVVYDMVSPIGPVYYSFLFTMKNGNQLPTPVQIYNP
jgi:hypothetical protein